MKNILSEYIDKFQKHHKDYRRYIVILILLAFATFVVVNWQLHQTGISMTADYQCGYKEHTHTDDCYTKVLICGKEETDGSEGHTHTDDCYEEQKELTCSKEEHTHDDSCYDEDGNLICGKEEHTHTDDCYTTKKVLICGKEESPKVEAHHHTDKCYEKKLTCKLPEHTHTVECLSNEKADVETASDWEKTLPSNLGDDIKANVVAVAKSQIGYKESTKNFKLADDGKTKKGYTRYGDWYGDKYGDWSAMFASFVYHYAGVSKKTVPVNSGAYAWTVDLKKSGLYKTTSDYSPAAGDLVFFDTDKDGKADQVGVVEKVTDSKITVVEGDYKDEVAENSYKVSDDTITGYCSLPTKEKKKVTALRSKKQARVVANEVNLNDYVTSGTFQKKIGAFWENSTEFNVTDQVRASINIKGIPKSTLQENGNTARLQLPKGLDCSYFKGQTYETKDNDKKSGTYTYEQDGNGNWYIVLKLDDDYVENAGETIDGNLKFEFQWDENLGSQEGKTETISIGNWNSTVTIKKDENKKPDETGTNFSISKNDSKIHYDQNGVGYLDYTITLKVDKDTTGPINLTDIFEGKNWSYDNISASNISVNWKNKNTSTDKGVTSTIQVGNNGQTIKAGTYTITYRMKNDKINDPNISVGSPVHNTISVPDGDKTISSDKWTHMSTSNINKQGQLTQSDGKNYIDYTIYLNAGDIIKDIKNGTTFTDTLPNGVKLVGDVKVEQFDVNGNLQNTTTATVNGKNISYTTPKGQYYYRITYRVEEESPESIPIGGLVVNNTGTSKGDISGSSSTSNTLPSHYLTKEYVNQNVSQDENGKWINNMKWKSTINFEGSLDGYTYEDWAEVVWSNILGGHICPTTMSDAQRKAIKVLDKNGNPISKDLYEITTSDHKEQNISNGLFKIIFKGNVKGPIQLEYETTADLTSYTLNQDIRFVNYASITKDGKGENTQASTPSFKYTHDSNKIIYKYGQDFDYSEPSNSSITLPIGENSVSWNIMLNKGQNLTGDLIVTDTIAKDLTFLKDSLKVNIQYGDDITDKVEYTYDESTQLLKIKIPDNCYNQNQTIIISYRTELPKSFFSGSDLTETFKNTASVEQNGTKTDSTFEQTVTRKVISKSGRYDKKNQTLTYEIVVNPEASRLNEGNTLTILDTLNSGALKGHIQLKGLTAFTALKTTDSNGNTKIEPGSLVKSLTQSSDAASKKDFTYYWDESSEQFKAYLPDNTAYILVAEYYIQGELSNDVSLSNSVQIQGEKTWKADDNYTTVEKDTSGETYTNKDSISIVKHDSAQYNNLLNGAEFKLEKYDNGNWVDAKSTSNLTISSTLITGSGNNGTGKAYTAVQRNVLYRLTETKAPNKYIIDDTPHYFIVVTEGSTPSLPEDIKDKVNIYTVLKGDTEFANVVIDRYNAYDKTTVAKGELRVNKEWVGGDGKIVTNPTELAKMKDVKVTLTKKVTNTKKHTVTLKFNDYAKQIITDLSHGCYIKFTSWFNNDVPLAQFEDTNMTITKSGSGPYTYKIGPVLSDSTITIIPEQLYYNIMNLTSENDTRPKTVILNPANDWSHLWTNLDTSDGIQYILTEETIDGYKATYKIDNNDLTSGSAFSLGLNGNIITVTNTADEEYVLPETGGIGTLPFTVGGIILITLALLCGYALKRKR